MARKLSVLEVLLITFFLIVLIVDILLLLLVFEKPLGKGDACGHWVGRIGKGSPFWMPKKLFCFFTLRHATHIALFTIQVNLQKMCSFFCNCALNASDIQGLTGPSWCNFNKVHN